MSRIWARIIKKHRIIAQNTVESAYEGVSDALRELCREFDIPAPIWLPKHEREYEQFRHTSFTREHFVEDVNFDKLEVEFLDDTGEKRASNDPRNQF